MSTLSKLKSKVFDNAKVAGQAAANVIQYTAPIAGNLLGPLGGLAGTAVGTAAATVGAKDKSAAIKREATYGLSITAGTAALGALSGAGAGSGLIGSFSKIFGGSPASQAATSPLSVGAQAVPSTPGGGLSPGANAGTFGDFLGKGTGQLGSQIRRLAASTTGQPSENASSGLLPWVLGGAAIVAVLAFRK